MDEKDDLVSAKKNNDNSEVENESVKVEKEKCKDDSYIDEWNNQNASSNKKGILLNKLSSSDTNLGKKSTLSKIFNWEPWTKIKRKNKKNKRKKDFLAMKMDYDSSDSSTYNMSAYSIGEPSNLLPHRDISIMHDQYSRESYNRKQVKFQTDVRVIHFDSDRILGDTVEPLKKELDQQLRNIQLRKEKAAEALDVMRTKSKKSVTNYMSSWRKK